MKNSTLSTTYRWHRLLSICVWHIMASSGLSQIAQSTDVEAHVVVSDVTDHSFVLNNSSDDVLKVMSHKTSCACLEVVDCPGEIAPRSHGTLVVRMNPKAMRGRTSQSAVLKTSDKTHPYRRFVLYATIRSVWLEPEELDFGMVGLSQTASRDAFVMTAGVRDVHVAGIESTDDRFGIALIEMERPKTLVKGDVISSIRATVCGRDLGAGEHSARLRLRTDHDEFHELAATLKVFVTGKMKARPSQLYFGRARSGSEVVRSCTVTAESADDDSQLENVRVRADKSFVEPRLLAKFNTVSGRQIGKLEVRITVPAVEETSVIKGIVSGRVEDETVFSVPYIVYAAP